MKTRFQITIIRMLALLVSITFLASKSNRAEILYHSDGVLVKTRMPIDVTNVDDLYKEVNNPVNAGAIIRLAPGKYELNEVKSPATAGRLEFQKDMSIIGYVDFSIAGQPENRPSIIDGSKLLKTSFKPTGAGQPGKTGCIRMGRGHNVLSFITLIGNPNTEALSGIDTDLDYKNPVVEISHCVVMNCQQGIDIRNVAANGVNRKLTAFIYHNVLKENLVQIGQQGLSIQNSNGADHAKIKVFMSHNQIYGSPRGMRIMNLNVIHDTIEVISNGDRFDNQQTAIIIWTGQHDSDVAESRIVSENYVSFISYNIHIGQNILVKDGLVYGPVFAVAGNTKFLPEKSNNNTLHLSFYSPDFEKNFSKIYVFGARNETNVMGGSNTGLAGKFNKAFVCVDGGVKVKSADSDISVPGHGNVVSVGKCLPVFKK